MSGDNMKQPKDYAECDIEALRPVDRLLFNASLFVIGFAAGVSVSAYWALL